MGRSAWEFEESGWGWSESHCQTLGLTQKEGVLMRRRVIGSKRKCNIARKLNRTTSLEFIKSEPIAREHAWSLCIHVTVVQLGLYVELLAKGAEATRGALTTLGNLFFMLGCLTQPEYRGRFLVLWQLDIPCFAELHGDLPFSDQLWRKMSGWWGRKEEGMRGEEGVKAAVRM